MGATFDPGQEMRTILEAMAAWPEDPRQALRAYAGAVFAVSPRATRCFERILDRVRAIDEASARGFQVHLEGGGLFYCATQGYGAKGAAREVAASVRHLLGRVSTLWLYTSAEMAQRNDHQLMFAGDAGPPEGDRELEGTPFEGAGVTWFLEDGERYWFVTAAEPEVSRCFDLDGGIAARSEGNPAEVLAARIVELLDE